jgi:hypothetical protein
MVTDLLVTSSSQCQGNLCLIRVYEFHSEPLEPQACVFTQALDVPDLGQCYFDNSGQITNHSLRAKITCLRDVFYGTSSIPQRLNLPLKEKDI